MNLPISYVKPEVILLYTMFITRENRRVSMRQPRLISNNRFRILIRRESLRHQFRRLAKPEYISTFVHCVKLYYNISRCFYAITTAKE